MINIETSTYYMTIKEYELSFSSLETDLDADMVVIGDGFPSINIVLELAEHDTTDIVVPKAHHFSFDGTRHNGGQVVAGIGHDLEKIRRDASEDGLRAIFETSDLDADIIKGHVKEYTIDANFCHGYDYMGSNARQAKTLQTWEEEFRSLGSSHEIRYLYGAKVRQTISSNAYGSALLHMGDDHVYSLNLPLGEARALASLDARIFEYSPALEMQYGERIHVRTAKGSVTTNRLLWACDSFLNRLEPELHRTIINTYASQMVAEPLPDELIQRISSIRGVYSGIHPVIGYYRMANENRLLFGTAAPFVERAPGDLKAWNRKLILKISPYLEHVRIDLIWGRPMVCSANLFSQIGSLLGRPNVSLVRGYSGFGVTPSHIVCRILAEGMNEGSACYDLFGLVCHVPIHGRNHFRPLLLSAGRAWHQSSGYWNSRC